MNAILIFSILSCFWNWVYKDGVGWVKSETPKSFVLEKYEEKALQLFRNGSFDDAKKVIQDARDHMYKSEMLKKFKNNPKMYNLILNIDFRMRKLEIDCWFNKGAYFNAFQAMDSFLIRYPRYRGKEEMLEKILFCGLQLLKGAKMPTIESGLFTFWKNGKSQGRKIMQWIVWHYRKSSVSDRAQYFLSKSLLINGLYEEAELELKTFFRYFPTSNYIEAAEFLYASIGYFSYRIEQRDVRPLKLALRRYKAFLATYPNSQSKNKIVKYRIKIREMLAEHELYIARQYLGRYSVLEAIPHIFIVLKDYSTTSHAKKAEKLFKQLKNDIVPAVIKYHKKMEKKKLFKLANNKILATIRILQFIKGNEEIIKKLKTIKSSEKKEKKVNK